MTEKNRRGFASMDKERQREIASRGGRAAHAKGTAHQWTSDEAKAAGRKGGMKSRRPQANHTNSDNTAAPIGSVAGAAASGANN